MIHLAFVITCDGHACNQKIVLIGPNATSYRGARGYASHEGWTTNDEVDVGVVLGANLQSEMLLNPLRVFQVEHRMEALHFGALIGMGTGSGE